MATRKNSRRCTEEEAILLWKLVLSHSWGETELAKLKEDLAWVECERLLDLPWSFKDEAMVREVLKGAPNQFTCTLKCDPSQWIPRKWRGVYKFQSRGSRLALHKDDFARGKFAHIVGTLLGGAQ